MSLMAVSINSCSFNTPNPAKPVHFRRRVLNQADSFSSLGVSHTRIFYDDLVRLPISQLFRTRSFRDKNVEGNEAKDPKVNGEENDKAVETFVDEEIGAANLWTSFSAKLGIAVVVAMAVTFISIRLKGSSLGSALGIQLVADGSSTSSLVDAAGFTFKAFGYRFILPEYAPGWVYFWLLMAAGCGLFISEEALNIWVGISLARMLSLDGTWHSFVESFSAKAPYIMSTVLWVYWGVCISDMIPFYIGKLFRQSGASDDVCSKLGIGEDKASSIRQIVQKYGNLTGFVERFSLGVRNPTAFLAGALGISPECFFAGVCCGGLITLPVQLGIGFLVRKRPVFALATVATAVGVWTIFPYILAASTALYLLVQGRGSSV